MWKNDEELFKIVKKELFTALVGDILDQYGYYNQFVPPGIKPVATNMVTIGRAMPVVEADIGEQIVKETRDDKIKQAFGLMFEALDDLKTDEVYICSGSTGSYALWGGLMSIRATKLHAAGAVLDGFIRDTNEIINLGFPTFSYGSYAADQGVRGKVIDYRVPIKFGGVVVDPGDIVYGDRDGTIIIPKKMERIVFEGAIEKSRGEKLVKKALENGMSCVNAYKRFGLM
jgi:regulator of RNase E activity RraA